MICKNCGKYYPDSKEQCPYCGAPNLEPPKESNKSFYNSSSWRAAKVGISNSQYPETPHKRESFSIGRTGLGFILGFFFGILGLLGLLACSDSEEKNAFMQGWIIAFIISILIVVIAVFALIGFAACLPYRYYY